MVSKLPLIIIPCLFLFFFPFLFFLISWNIPPASSRPVCSDVWLLLSLSPQDLPQVHVLALITLPQTSSPHGSSHWCGVEWGPLVDIDDRLDGQGVAHLGKAEAGRGRGKKKKR